jgi:hypothetical protein
LPIEEIELKRNTFGFIEECSNYPGDDLDPDRDWNRAQLIAQYRAFAEANNYKVDANLKQKIDGHIAKLTPQNESEEVAQVWFEAIQAKVMKRLSEPAPLNEFDTNSSFHVEHKEKWSWIESKGIVNIRDCSDVIKEVSVIVGKPVGVVKMMLKEQKISDPNKQQRGYPGRGVVKGIYKIREEDLYTQEDENVHSENKESESLDEVLSNL